MVGTRSGLRTGTSLTAGAGCDVEQLSGFIDINLVPGSAGDDHSLSGAHLHVSMSVPQFQPDPDASRKQIEKLVGVRVHLTSVRRWSPEGRGLDGIALDAVGGPARGSRYEHGAPGLALETHSMIG
jgi:hypothetical protein